MPVNWELIEKVIPHSRRTLLHGPPGTGKTTCAVTGDEEAYFVSLHDESTVAELMGHFIPVGDRFVWLNGPALQAWVKGAKLVVDEIDLASGAVMSVMRGILNDEGVARLSIPDASMASMSNEELGAFIADGKGMVTVRPAEGFQVVATMNGEPADLDEPLRDRFDAMFHITEPHPNALKRLPAPLREVAKRTAMETNPDRRVTLRRWLSFVHLAKKTGDTMMAADAAFGARGRDVLVGVSLAGIDFTGKGAKPKPKVKPKTRTVADVEAEEDATLDAAERKLMVQTRSKLRALARSNGLSQHGEKLKLVRRLVKAGVTA